MSITEQIDRILAARKAAIPRVDDQIRRASVLQEYLSRLCEAEKDFQLVGLTHVIENLRVLTSQVYCVQTLLSSLRARFNRDFLTVLTFGLAGTGKSRTLLTLTNLPETELLSRKGNHCTGTIVEVLHTSEDERSYEVTTYSKEEFFRDLILPYFHALGVNTPPASLQEFRDMQLPEPKNASKLIGQKNAREKLQLGRYEHLLEFRCHLTDFEEYLTGTTFKISASDVPIWTTYPSSQDEKPDWRCLAARSTKLRTLIPLEEFRKVRLYDTPGLGSHRVGELERLARYVDDEADAVLRIDRPDPLRPRPELLESEIHDQIESQLRSGVALSEMLTVVLNRLLEHAPNEEMCTLELEKSRKNGRSSEFVVIADCSNRQELIDLVILPLMKRLMNNCQAIDSRRIDLIESRLLKTAEKFEQILQTIKIHVESKAPRHDVEELFAEWFEKCQADLREALFKLKHEALLQHDEGDSVFLEKISKATEKARNTVLVPSEEEIHSYQIRTSDRQLGGTVDHFVQKLRFDIGEVFRGISGELGREVIRAWQDRMRDALSLMGVNHLTQAEDPASFFEELAQILDSSGVCPRITKVCRMVVEFRIEFPHVLYAVWLGLENLHPNRFLGKFGDALADLSIESDAEYQQLSLLLEDQKGAAIAHIAKELKGIVAYPANYCWALVWDIHDQLTLSAEVAREWRLFMRRHRERLMPGRSDEDEAMLDALTRISGICNDSSILDISNWSSYRS